MSKKLDLKQTSNRIASDIQLADEKTKSTEGANKKLRQQITELQRQPMLAKKDIPETLDEIEQEIKNLASAELIAVWLQGERLNAIRDRKLFEDRNFKSFTKYCEDHLEFTRQTAYNAIFVYKVLDWERVESMRADPTKIYLLRPLQTDTSELDKMINWIETDLPSKRQVQERMRELLPAQPERINPKSIKVKENWVSVKLKLESELRLDLSTEDKVELGTAIETFIRQWLQGRS